MKGTIKWFGIIALVAIIGFSMAACDSGSPASSSGGGHSATWIAIPAGDGTGGSTFPIGASVDRIHGIAYGSGTFIAVGEAGRMARSTDNGVTWTAIPAGTGTNASTFPAADNIRGIAYGNGTFIAVGDNGRMAHSTDNGVTWAAILVSGWHVGIAFGNNTFITTTTGGNGHSSTDEGATWTSTSIWGAGTRGITFGDGTFITVGHSGAMRRSSNNGANWANIPGGTGTNASTFPTSAPADQIYGIAYGSGTFIAVGRAGRMARSTDSGVTWTAIPAGIGTDASTFPVIGAFDSIRGIAYGNGTFIAVGDRGRMASSADNGVTWIAIPGGTGTNASTFPSNALGGIHSIAYGNGTFIAVGDMGRMARKHFTP